MSLEIRNIRDLSQVNGRAMLFHLVPSIAPETGCSNNADLQKENVVEHHNA
jgi:hypothetical protein